MTDNHPKFIKNHEGYLVYPDGRVFCIDKGYFIKPGLSNGYHLASLPNPDGVRKSYYIHRLVAHAFLENPHRLPQVNHINGVRSDNRVENLEWCTGKDNLVHFYNNHYDPKVHEKGHRKRLDRRQVIHIRQLILDGVRTKDIAKEFNVNPCIISSIKHNKAYKYY